MIPADVIAPAEPYRIPPALRWLMPNRWNLGLLLLFWVLAPWLYDGGMAQPFEATLRPMILPYYFGIVAWDMLERALPAAVSTGSAYWTIGKTVWPYVIASAVAVPLRVFVRALRSG